MTPYSFQPLSRGSQDNEDWATVAAFMKEQKARLTGGGKMPKEMSELDSAVFAYNAVRRMNFADFRDFMTRFATLYFEQGTNAVSSAGNRWDDDQIYELLRSERIGNERAKRIAARLAAGPEERNKDHED